MNSRDKYNYLSDSSWNKYVRFAITKMFPKVFLRSFYSKNLGIPWDGKKSCLTISFDCDFREDIKSIPILLDVLSSFTFKTCFACVGMFVKEYPRQHACLIENGHEILNHTYSHPNSELNPNQRFNQLNIEEQKNEIQGCHEICKRLLDYEPKGFRVPHFGVLYTPTIYPILNELKYSYSSSIHAFKTPKHGLPFWIQGLLEFPISGCPKHPFEGFDTYHSLRFPRASHRKGSTFRHLFNELVEIGINTNSYINVYFDPQDIIRLKNFEELFNDIEQKRDVVQIKTYEEILVHEHSNPQ
jgi:hypothetical protein